MPNSAIIMIYMEKENIGRCDEFLKLLVAVSILPDGAGCATARSDTISSAGEIGVETPGVCGGESKTSIYHSGFCSFTKKHIPICTYQVQFFQLRFP